MTTKQRLYIESLTRELGIGRTWADGVRFVLGRVPWSRYNSPAAIRRNQELVAYVIDDLRERVEWQRYRRRRQQQSMRATAAR